MKEVLIKAAREAGKLLLDKFRDPQFSQIAVNKGRFDYSIKMDRMTEELILEILKENNISGKVVAEETGEISLGTSDYTLYIDPLDGTFNYAHGIPHYAVSIGVEAGDEVVMAVIYDPNADEVFFAEKNKGAFLNGKTISVSKTDGLDRSIVNLFSRSLKERPELADMYTNLIRSAYIRMPMSAVLALAYTSCGRTDATIGFRQNKWDVAAGVLLVTEAGGKVTTTKGDDYSLDSSDLIASNSILHKKLLEIMAIE